MEGPIEPNRLARQVWAYATKKIPARGRDWRFSEPMLPRHVRPSPAWQGKS